MQDCVDNIDNMFLYDKLLNAFFTSYGVFMAPFMEQ